ncbi:MAG: tetratricopeptide repeat protein [Chitinophagaceae bacterium]
MLPIKAPGRMELVNQIRQSSQQVKAGLPAPKLEEIRQTVESVPVEAINDRAILSFYQDDPRSAIALMMETAAREPDNLLLLNNLGAMLNMSGAEHKAIPLLQYCLEKIPKSSTVLNNIGQSFMGLGDLLKAADFFRRCLAIDSLNPEANHSMGMLHYFKKEYDAAMACFERELAVSFRRSTMAMSYRMGKKFNTRSIMERRRKIRGRQSKDHFEEITLGRFSFPELPGSSQQLLTDRYLYNQYGASVQAEQLNWMSYASSIAASYASPRGDEYPGLYSDLVAAMLEDLGEEFNEDFLMPITDADMDHVRELIDEATKRMNQVKCPPAEAGMGIEAQEAHEIRCCREQLKPIADELVATLSGYLQPLIRKGELRWKWYINQLVETVQLDPSPGNKMMVYNAVAGYFSFQQVAMVSFPVWELNNLLPKCSMNLSNQEIDSLIQSDRDWNLNCPPWLNAEFKFDGMALKMDCNKYQIEVGGAILGGFEHEFKTGKSTFLLGPATKAEFLGLTGELKSQLYLSFDGDKKFADFGIKNTAELGLTGTPIPVGPHVKIGGNLAGIELSQTLGLNSGYQESVEKKGIIAKIFESP